MPTFIKPDLDLYLLCIPQIGSDLLKEYDEANTYEDVIEWVFGVLKKSDNEKNEVNQMRYEMVFDALFGHFTKVSYSFYLNPNKFKIEKNE